MKIIHTTQGAIQGNDKILWVINQSGTMELEATLPEIEEFERVSGLVVEDVIPDWMMAELLVHLNFEEQLSHDYEFVCQ